MSEQSKNQHHKQKDHSTSQSDSHSKREHRYRNMPQGDPDAPMPETNDAGDAISEASLYDASGAATGGGVDISDAVMRSTERDIRRRKTINQESSAYTGGGSDNGTNL